MTAKFYYNSADRIVLDKTSYLTLEATETNFYLKDDTELLNPTIVVESDKLADNINYVYLGGNMKRYYFVDNITYSQGRIIMNLSVDVLMSHKDDILKNEFIIWRNQSIYNRYLTDDRQLTEASSRILTFPFEGGDGTFTGAGKTASYILSVSGRSLS